MTFRRSFVTLFFAALCVSFAAAGYAADDAVVLPSRFGNAAPAPPPDDTAAMVEEWMAATGNIPSAADAPPRPYMVNRTKKLFVFGAVTPPAVICRAGGITDIELEPGERVTNFSISDESKWSVSAAWSGSMDEIVTHVLLRTFFPGVKSDLVIHTDRRVYSIGLTSSLDGLHMSYVGFKYPEAEERAEEQIPPGRYRDLLARYGLVDDGPEAAAPPKRLVDGADVNFRYAIKPLGSKKKIPWAPTSVYDAEERTYFVMPDTKETRDGLLSLFIVTNGKKIPAPYKIVKDGLYSVDRLFDEAVIKFAGDEVSVERIKE
jgi:type IV secretion system protein VirB9